MDVRWRVLGPWRRPVRRVDGRLVDNRLDPGNRSRRRTQGRSRHTHRWQEMGDIRNPEQNKTYRAVRTTLISSRFETGD